MIKYIIILMNMLALLVVRMFFTGDVNVKISAPDKVKPGDEITVSLTITKGALAGVGHMKQELPAGFGNASVIEAKGAEFKYLPEDNVVKFTWISLPSDPEFTISYKIKVDAAAANGNVNLAGKFSYVLNNEKQTFELPPTIIKVGEETLATTTTTTQAETTATTVTQPETTATNVTRPETTATATNVTQTEKTNTTVTQPETTATNVTQPETTATATNVTQTEKTNTATQTQTTSTTTQPEKTPSNITASRTIVGSPEAGTEFTVEVSVKKTGIKGFARIQETLPAGLTAMSLDNKGGTFSFIDQKVKIIWDNLPAEEEVKVSYRVSVSENASGDMSIIGSFSYVENNDPMKAEIPTTSISVKAKSLALNTNTTSITPPETTITNVPNPESHVAFKVQICALSKTDRSNSYFQSKYGISNNVSMELHEGWRKYVVGKYSQYKDARDYRETIRVKGVENPFVTAYNQGKRITVQEALMVSNQKWVR
ncbi:MAG TPA: hypothetical protein VII99_15360 [Bacteroidia bacterium]